MNHIAERMRTLTSDNMHRYQYGMTLIAFFLLRIGEPDIGSSSIKSFGDSHPDDSPHYMHPKQVLYFQNAWNFGPRTQNEGVAPPNFAKADKFSLCLDWTPQDEVGFFVAHSRYNHDDGIRVDPTHEHFRINIVDQSFVQIVSAADALAWRMRRFFDNAADQPNAYVALLEAGFTLTEQKTASFGNWAIEKIRHSRGLL